MKCPYCDKDISDDSLFCPQCGKKIIDGEIDKTNYFNDNVVNNEKLYDEPITILGYVGYSLLYMIPVVGLICFVIFAITSKNINVKNYTLSMLLMTIIMTILIIVMMICGISLFSYI